MTNVLLLGSKSNSRIRLLKDAGIPFELISQNFAEDSFSWDLPIEDLVKKIAKSKMDNLILPKGNENNSECFVLTADTLGTTKDGHINGKPKDKQDAIRMIKNYRSGAYTCTAFCLDKKIWNNFDNKWETKQRILECVGSRYIFYIPDDWIERYFELSLASGINYLQVSGAVAIEEFGAQFLKSMNGSYTTVVGLPMFEVREALSKIGF